MHLHAHAPEPRLSLVSRQFASQYYERSPPKDEICLSVTGGSQSQHLQSAGGFIFAARASAVDVTLTFAPFDYSLYTYVDYLISWLSKLVEDMPCVETLHIELCFSIYPTLEMFAWFSRTTHRASPYIAVQFHQLPKNRNNKKPIE